MNKKVILWMVIGSCVVMMGKWCYGEPFLIRETRPMAMGGAFAAVAEDAITSHWNPAGLAKQRKRFDVEIPFYVDITGTGDIAKKLDEISKVGYESIRNMAENRNYREGPIDVKYTENFFRLLDCLDNLNKEGVAIIINTGMGLNLRIKDWGLSTVYYGMISGDPTIDLTNITLGKVATPDSVTEAAQDAIYSIVGEGIDYTPGFGNWTNEYENFAQELMKIIIQNTNTPIFKTQDQAERIIKIALDAGLDFEDVKKYTTLVSNVVSKMGDKLIGTTTTTSINNNKSTLIVKGCFINEFMVTHGREFSFLRKNLYLGANLKYMRAVMAWFDPQIFKKDVKKEIKDVKSKYTKESSSFGIDLGMLYDITPKLSIGLVTKNINSPSFDYPNAANLPKYKIKPQIRAGVCYKPWKGMTLAGDLDLTRNKTILDGFDSKILSTGFEWQLFNFLILRAGLLKNLIEDSVGTVYTSGLGINLLGLHAEASGMMSDKKTQTEKGKKIPAQLSGSIQISLNF